MVAPRLNPCIMSYGRIDRIGGPFDGSQYMQGERGGDWYLQYERLSPDYLIAGVGWGGVGLCRKPDQLDVEFHVASRASRASLPEYDDAAEECEAAALPAMPQLCPPLASLDKVVLHPLPCIHGLMRTDLMLVDLFRLSTSNRSARVPVTFAAVNWHKSSKVPDSKPLLITVRPANWTIR